MATEITNALLTQWALPIPGHDGDKEERGHVMIIAGSSEIPGAAVLASVAALRSGAGKLTVVTAPSIAPQVGQSLPEARVMRLPALIEANESDASWLPQSVDAVLIGPGMQDEDSVIAIVKTVVTHYPDKPIILDAIAMETVKHIALPKTILITPHAGEMAGLRNCDKHYVTENAEAVALQAASQWQIAVALKGPQTFIALPDRQVWIHRGGNVGLATSGSGDVMAGLIVGLLAQGAALEQAAAWGVALHALAGEAAAKDIGNMTGYLASELAYYVPRLRATLAQR